MLSTGLGPEKDLNDHYSVIVVVIVAVAVIVIDRDFTIGTRQLSNACNLMQQQIS